MLLVIAERETMHDKASAQNGEHEHLVQMDGCCWENVVERGFIFFHKGVDLEENMKTLQATPQLPIKISECFTPATICGEGSNQKKI